jgi:hypothetical protein
MNPSMICRIFHWLQDAPLILALRLLDVICDPEPPTLADLIREQEHERLREQFPHAPAPFQPPRWRERTPVPRRVPRATAELNDIMRRTVARFD